MDRNTKILIVGAGCFGTSTAYHLAQRGFTSIRVLDRYPTPSCEAASTDISKIIRSDYNEPLYARLGIEAIAAWKSSALFRGLYHVPGWVLSAYKLSCAFVEGSIETCTKLGVEGLERLSTQQIRERFPLVTGELDGWNINVWNPTAGWAAAGEALRRMAVAAQEQGVDYISGEEGWVKRLLFDEEKRCTGVITADGSTHVADLVVVAAGAWTPTLLDVAGQLTAKGHSVAHIQLSPAETAHYSALPIMDNLELGYFFPPQADGVFKMAHSQFITNMQTDTQSGNKSSVPHTFVDNPQDDLPLEIEAQMRRNLRRVLPELADRPFCYTRLCWDADTADRHFLISPHPNHQGLYVAAGGSAHGFKFLPVLGKYIADLLEGNLESDIAQQWQWRAGQTVTAKNLAHQDPELELSDLTGWKGRKTRERGPRL
ncbi:fructosyl amino acid oxidase [Aspergillus costaricaensis CBS 115574]|uniref:Fructosyl amino acid oxidase n=1 Tax=Aspergillus costaricaensis CBS 115574 TaxID=1448317 RepID=A0ACD1ITC5_9EURO|nr:fructosyl amino acid oxidase [Aspergillus costaricaensis CBS 115574]RAK93702.1 fructosyl amino acid oxidase [Aspergillus costaricaensis CBS 115574]